MNTKDITRVIKFIDDAIENLAEIGGEYEIPPKVYDNLASALAILEMQLRFTSEDRMEELDFAKEHYTLDEEETDED